MSLEDNLILNRYFHHLLGAEGFEELKSLLRLVNEGPGSDGQSFFYGRLLTQPDIKLDRDSLRLYDQRLMDYETRLVQSSQDFKALRYFQYLALLYTEIFLDKVTSAPNGFLLDLNKFLADLRKKETVLHGFPYFTLGDLRRLAFFMATGSGKTLLLHANVWQVMHYLEHGRHPEMLVQRSDGRRAFDNILLITPNEGLSDQHIKELRTSGLDAGLFIDDPHGHGGLFGPKVKVIEIHKLAEEPSKDGVSVVLDELGSNNLVFVDEGHKGAGSEAKVWKSRQQRLSKDGFLLEYSATFAQAIGAASKKLRKELIEEYGKVILFDYSYAHFYGDGYGKNFNVLNLAKARASQAHELLVGALLTYFQQLELFQKKKNEYRPYNIEKPLWVLLGSSVNAIFTLDKKRRSDVAEVVAFLQRFLVDEDWAIKTIDNMLGGNSGFSDDKTGQDLFLTLIHLLRGRKAKAVYEKIRKEVFHGAGGLAVWELKNTDGEFGLRVSASGEHENPYFGVINIGDSAAFRKYLEEYLDITVQEDKFSASQFKEIENADSRINILVGAKKFTEGWSSWRVSSMGLLNVGQGEGSQVIQLFGRGVRLKGKNMSLKRSKAFEDGHLHPEAIENLETLYISGWNANYIHTFREMIEREDIGEEFLVPVKHKTPWPKKELPVPVKNQDFNLDSLTWKLASEPPIVNLDLTPIVKGLSPEGEVTVISGHLESITVPIGESPYFDVLDIDILYSELLAYKIVRGYENVFISREQIFSILKNCCSLRMPENESKNPERLMDAAEQILKMYLDRYVRRQEREYEGQNLKPGWLLSEQIVSEYRVRVKKNGFLKQIEKLLKKPLKEIDDGEPLPRLYFARHLFNPVLTDGGKKWKEQISVRPPALGKNELTLLRDLRIFWEQNHKKSPYCDCEIFLLRNLPKAGIGLFNRSGFYPDFILWIKNKKNGTTHVRFLDPHGLHHGGLDGSHDKFEALRKLKTMSEQPEFKKKKIVLDGFILANTRLEHIPDAAGRSWNQLEKEYPLLRQESGYEERIFPLDSEVPYFAYGSNMDGEDIDRWCKEHSKDLVVFSSIKPAVIKDYKLVFNHFSKGRGCGAANIMSSKRDRVYGLLCMLKEKDLSTIREKEGWPSVYEEIFVDVETFDGKKIEKVLTYKLVKERGKEKHQRPTKYYLGLLIRAAERYSFPSEYIQYLKTIDTKE